MQKQRLKGAVEEVHGHVQLVNHTLITGLAVDQSLISFNLTWPLHTFPLQSSNLGVTTDKKECCRYIIMSFRLSRLSVENQTCCQKCGVQNSSMSTLSTSSVQKSAFSFRNQHERCFKTVPVTKPSLSIYQQNSSSK